MSADIPILSEEESQLFYKLLLVHLLKQKGGRVTMNVEAALSQLKDAQLECRVKKGIAYVRILEVKEKKVRTS